MEIFYDFKENKTYNTLRIDSPVTFEGLFDLEDEEIEFEVTIGNVIQMLRSNEYWNYVFNIILPAERIEGFTDESGDDVLIDNSIWVETGVQLSDEGQGEIHSDGNIQLNEQHDGEDRLSDGFIDNDATYEVSFPLPCSSRENASSCNSNSSGKRPRPDVDDDDDDDDEDLMITNHLELEPQSKRSRL